ncbi:hypothetical protein BJV78DRAFT_739998 [Lactifluus subvellereus]|nr:hypothetical protein BJV78DRAFT_739998 [Lactifluus subvellereus]
MANMYTNISNKHQHIWRCRESLGFPSKHPFAGGSHAHFLFPLPTSQGLWAWSSRTCGSSVSTKGMSCGACTSWVVLNFCRYHLSSFPLDIMAFRVILRYSLMTTALSWGCAPMLFRRNLPLDASIQPGPGTERDIGPCFLARACQLETIRHTL